MKTRTQLLAGRFRYNGRLARWWLYRAEDRFHQHAYRKIAKFIRDSIARPPILIVDYACGAGNLLHCLGRLFPQSRLIGLDGSTFLLEIADRRFSSKCLHPNGKPRLKRAMLPEFALPCVNADLIVFAFPNMMPLPRKAESRLIQRYLRDDDRVTARDLAFTVKSENDDTEEDPKSIQSSLLRNRLISLNLRRLLKRGGLCVRVEYGKAQRHELSPYQLMRVCFEEGAVGADLPGKRQNHWFRVLASSYFRSRVIEDVYQHTGNEQDREGGFVITVLRAL